MQLTPFDCGYRDAKKCNKSSPPNHFSDSERIDYLCGYIAALRQ